MNFPFPDETPEKIASRRDQFLEYLKRINPRPKPPKVQPFIRELPSPEQIELAREILNNRKPK